MQNVEGMIFKCIRTYREKKNMKEKWDHSKLKIASW